MLKVKNLHMSRRLAQYDDAWPYSIIYIFDIVCSVQCAVCPLGGRSFPLFFPDIYNRRDWPKRQHGTKVIFHVSQQK